MTQDLFSSVGGGGKIKPRCHTTHKMLKFGKGRLLGASCGSPHKGYDIYIGFDWGMEFQHEVYPWETKKDPVIEFQFRIPDMGVPKSPKEFKKMITWVCSQLHKGKRIHVGCIGGHGRTGLFLAAVRAEFNDDKDAGNWVREHHCKRAIESQTQINFLYKHFGIKKIKPSKTSYKGWVDKTGARHHILKSNKFDKYLGNGVGNPEKNVIPFTGGKAYKQKTMKHMKGQGSIWE